MKHLLHGSDLIPLLQLDHKLCSFYLSHIQDTIILQCYRISSEKHSLSAILCDGSKRRPFHLVGHDFIVPPDIHPILRIFDRF